MLQDTGENAETADIYFNTGGIHLHLADYPKALEYYEKARDIYIKVLGIDHPNVAGCLNNIGSAYKEQGDYTKALEYYKKSLDIN